MRKGISMLLACVMLLASMGAVLAEPGITMTFASGENELLRINGILQEGQWVIVSDQLSGIAFQMDWNDQDAQMVIPTELLGNAVSEVMNTWMSYHTPETAYGVYAGDAFDVASVRKTWRFSLGDLTAMLLMLENRLWRQEETEWLAERLLMWESNLAELAGSSDCEVLLNQYDEGAAVGMIFRQAGETVGTLSVGPREEYGTIRAVLGYGENGKNYYLDLDIFQMNEERLSFLFALWADDERAGYRTLTSDQLICSGSWDVTAEQNRLEWTGGLTPANEIGSFHLSGWMDADAPEQEMFAQLTMEQPDGDERTLFTLSMKERADEEHLHLEDLRIFDLEDLSEDDLSELTLRLVGPITLLQMQMTRSLPDALRMMIE